MHGWKQTCGLVGEKRVHKSCGTPSLSFFKRPEVLRKAMTGTTFLSGVCTRWRPLEREHILASAFDFHLLPAFHACARKELQLFSCGFQLPRCCRIPGMLLTVCFAKPSSLIAGKNASCSAAKLPKCFTHPSCPPGGERGNLIRASVDPKAAQCAARDQPSANDPDPRRGG